MTITPCGGKKTETDKPGKTETGSLGRLLKDVVSAQFSLGKEIVGMVGSSCGMKLPKMETCCEIPEPCWMPHELGEIECELQPGGSGEVRLIVTNNDFRPHAVHAQAAGNGADHVQFSPAQVALGPKERTTIIARFNAKEQGSFDLVVWVTVCSDHYLRWKVTVGERAGKACCYEVTVTDTPDYQVHWYDHFYCMKPCLGLHGRTGAQG